MDTATTIAGPQAAPTPLALPDLMIKRTNARSLGAIARSWMQHIDGDHCEEGDEAIIDLSEKVRDTSETYFSAFDAITAEPIGVCVVRIDNPIAEIAFIAIHPRHRAKGLGKKFLKSTESALARKGVKKTIIHLNDFSNDFFEKCDYLKGDDWLEKEIEDDFIPPSFVRARKAREKRKRMEEALETASKIKLRRKPLFYR